MTWFETTPPDRWLSRLQAHPEELQDLFERFVRAELDPWADQDDLVAWDRWLGQLFEDADPDRLRRYICDWDLTARDIRRWCWAPGWSLMSQDQDLRLMSKEAAVPLLEEAALGCPRRDFALAIVPHWLRDALHHALFVPKDVSPEDGRTACLERASTIYANAAELVPLARRTGSAEVEEYLARLAAYGTERPVDHHEATQRAFDVRRCHPRPEEPVHLEANEAEFLAELKRASLFPGVLRIDRRTGAMWAHNVGEGDTFGPTQEIP